MFPLLRLNKRLNKQSRSCWFETPSSSLWRHTNVWVSQHGGCRSPGALLVPGRQHGLARLTSPSKPMITQYINYIVTSKWVRWRFKSPVSRLFAQLFVQAQIEETSKLRVTGLCEGNPPVTGGFPSQSASKAENASILLCHHGRPQPGQPWIGQIRKPQDLFWTDSATAWHV